MTRSILTYRYEIMLLVGFTTAGLMLAYSGLFRVNSFDWSQIRRGPVEILQGRNPYIPSEEDYRGTFNPPHLLVVGQPWILGSVQIWVLTMVLSVGLLATATRRPILGSYLLMAPFLIHTLASGNIGLQSGALALALLWVVQGQSGWRTAFLTAWAYGLLTVKPQMSAMIVVLHFAWLVIRQSADLKKIILCTILLVLVVPTLIGLCTGAVFQGQPRVVWYDWVDGVFFRDYDRVNVDTEGDFEPFINKFGAVGALLLSLPLLWIFIRRLNPELGYAIWRWDWSQFRLTDTFQLGASLMVIWMPYTDTTLVGLAWMLTLRPTQILAYGVIVWWLAVWIWPEESQVGIVFLPIQAYYLIPIFLAFADRNFPSDDSVEEVRAIGES
ncbi:MAG: hypothetical protein KJ064_00190 [Anaerolineae bacterium]|nr:hypothetical protein [Anaerolineae bacterium]